MIPQPTRNRPPPRWKQWAWFAGLWLGGLLCVFALSMVIKLVMNIG
ncbi:MAG: hypothetical protein WC989_07200 [Micavibrio sp.]